MKDKRADSRSPTGWVAWLSLATLGLWVVVVSTGTRLPFLYTSFAFGVRAFVLFPILFTCMAYFAIIYRKSNQPTGYVQAMSKWPTKRERVKATFFGILGLILIPGGIAWTS